MDILMPQLGETVTEGKITTWFKSVGDAVKPGDNLFEIETDKVTMEVPATNAGTLTEVRVAAGAVAPVGAVVAVVGVAGGVAPASSASGSPPPAAPAAPKAAAPASAPAGRPAVGFIAAVAAAPQKPSGPMDPFFEVRTPARNHGPAQLAGGTYVTPLARRLASESGIDLSRIKGSGPHGRIVAQDVETAAQTGIGRASAPAGPSAAQVLAMYRETPYEEVPLDGMRKTIATRLVQAKSTIPHFYLTADIDIDSLIAMREQANAAAPRGADGKPAYKLSLNDFVIKAWAAALKRIPATNAVWAEDRILRFQQVDIGIAVALDGGLLTPVVRHADAKSVGAIAADMRDFAERARAKKLQPAEYQGGATAISNLGMYGVREFAAIINPPHATILAVGASRRQAVEKPDGSVGFVSQISATVSYDHRVIDGALGAELLAAFRGFMEQPVTMLV
jgi:pyruvate dehydrogenase E2 component (dihydrolipoamide acetyltransferase)